MSRVGKKSVLVPKGVEVIVKGQEVKVKGPKGELQLQIHPLVRVAMENTEGEQNLSVTILDDNDGKQHALWGTTRSLLSNMINGVITGFSKKLEVNGVGYRVNVQGNTVVLNVGYSHDVRFEMPAGIQASVEGNVLTLTGHDKQLVGEVTAHIRKVRKPEPYKGKGIKYIDEVVRRKAGKATKSAE